MESQTLFDKTVRSWALIDGFNWYYAVREAIQTGTASSGLKWLDYHSMVSKVITTYDPACSVESVRWYTAYRRDDPPATVNHRWYRLALEAQGVETIEGKYKKKKSWCRSCGKGNDVWEEKATDVNIAIDIVSGAALDQYDCLFLFSADSDLVPAIRRAIEDFKRKVVVVVPSWRSGLKGRPQLHSEITKFATKLIRFPLTELGPELPDRVPVAGGKVARRPTGWK